MVLDAWYYTRAVGTDVVHGATTGSISTAASGVDIQGGVINTGVAWVTAATGILVFLKHIGGHNFPLYFSYCHNLSITFATD